MKTKLTALLLILLTTPLADAKVPIAISANPQYNCKLKAAEVADEANEILLSSHNIFPERYLIQPLVADYGKDRVLGSIEGYFRPGQDVDVNIGKKAKMQLRLDHTTDLIYLCIYYNTQELEHTHISIYFLEGNNLAGDANTSFTAKLTSLFKSDKIQVTNAPVSFEGILKLPKLAQQIIEKIPGINLLYALLKGVVMEPVDVLGGTVLDIARLKVEGIVLTPKGVNLESNIETGAPSVENKLIK